LEVPGTRFSAEEACDYPVKSFGDGKATGWAKYILSFVEHSD